MAADGEVWWAGAQRDLFAGDLRAHVSLERLAGLPHLYALGPAARLRGEITVVDGRAYVSRVEEGRIVVDRSFRHEAPFLVWSQVVRWHESEIPASIAGVGDFEPLLVERAREARVDTSRPFAFLLGGVPEALQLHVLDKRDDRRHTRALHDQIKVRFTVERVPVDVVGFYSTSHAGVFIPSGERLHLHVCTADERIAGHVERIRFAPGMRLRVPATAQAGMDPARAAR